MISVFITIFVFEIHNATMKIIEPLCGTNFEKIYLKNMKFRKNYDLNADI